MTERFPTPCVGVFCFRGRELLLIRRARAPNAGAWSVPGGRIDWGERAEAAALRELREETGVEGDLIGLVEAYDGLFPDAEAPEAHFVILEYAARWRAGEPRATEEALEARFFAMDEIEALGLTA
ncbi:MAG: NUDIX hydrolase, partial [Hyphomonadaceae bacterium]